jgi:hypothetical protein
MVQNQNQMLAYHSGDVLVVGAEQAVGGQIFLANHVLFVFAMGVNRVT